MLRFVQKDWLVSPDLIFKERSLKTELCERSLREVCEEERSRAFSVVSLISATTRCRMATTANYSESVRS